jgi:pheromone shutdown-related protein TraB
MDSIDEADIEQMKNEDILEHLLLEIEERVPGLRRILIDERDQYLAHKIKTAPGSRIVAVVGAGHVPGILKHWDETVDIAALNAPPPKSKIIPFFKWGIPLGVLGLIIFGFFMAGAQAGTEMIKMWVIANALFAGIGAALAFARPLTVLSAIVASPITSLNPMIAAGWVAGLVEVFIGKPKVKDFESLPEDIATVKGFWKNKITRILLVVVLTNLGSSFGAFVAIPLMAKAFS